MIRSADSNRGSWPGERFGSMLPSQVEAVFSMQTSGIRDELPEFTPLLLHCPDRFQLHPQESAWIL